MICMEVIRVYAEMGRRMGQADATFENRTFDRVPVNRSRVRRPGCAVAGRIGRTRMPGKDAICGQRFGLSRIRANTAFHFARVPPTSASMSHRTSAASTPSPSRLLAQVSSVNAPRGTLRDAWIGNVRHRSSLGRQSLNARIQPPFNPAQAEASRKRSGLNA